MLDKRMSRNFQAAVKMKRKSVVAAVRLCNALETCQRIGECPIQRPAVQPKPTERSKKVIPGTAGSCSTQGRPTGEKLKKGQLFHFT